MIKLFEVTHQSPVADKQVLQTATFQMRPHRAMKQNVATEEYPVGSIQKGNMIGRLAGRVNHFQIPAAKLEPITIPQL